MLTRIRNATVRRQTRNRRTDYQSVPTPAGEQVPNMTSNITSSSRPEPPSVDTSIDDNDSTHYSRPETTIVQNHDRGFYRPRAEINFVWMSLLFSANHGAVVSCLGLATSRLGSRTGAWQSGILYLTYTLSAICGTTYIVKYFGSRNAMIFGMTAYIVYVACFYFATLPTWSQAQEQRIAWSGAAIGGIGAGCLWTAQGSYFTRAAQEYHRQQAYSNETRQSSNATDHSGQNLSIEDANAKLAGIFAFIYLLEEVGLRSLSTLMLKLGDSSWSTVFATYSIVTILSTMGMFVLVEDYRDNDGSNTTHDVPSNEETEEQQEIITTSFETRRKIMATLFLLINDPKMKYMIGLNAVFGFSSAFLNSFVNGEVVTAVSQNGDPTGDPSAAGTYVGVLSAWLSVVAATQSLVFGGQRLRHVIGKTRILIIGACCFLFVAFPFLVYPDVKNNWSWVGLVFIYFAQGTGRATFEGTLKATFADYFAYEKEGAFANIILQNGFSGAIGYILTFSLKCASPSRYCVEYKDGTFHDVLTFELLIVVTAVLAIFGLWRASVIHASQSIVAQATHDETHASLLGTADAQSRDSEERA